IQASMKASEGTRTLGQIFLQQNNDVIKSIQASMKASEGTRTLGQIFLQQNIDMLNPMREALKPLQNLNMESLQQVAVMENTVSSSINQMDGVSSKQYYEGLVSVIGENNLNEAMIEEDNAINVISDSKLKSVCYRLTMVILIIAFSGVLTDQEIQGIWKFIVELSTVVGAFPIPTPVMKEVHHHHHHHHNDE
ncbi:hypothetical protein, partial [Bacillus paramycoides]|uniref:hypothetical protein n=1 Tax=Bacillus paramycoides TaxID=2026194 RepID=UPI003D1BE3AF